MTGYQLPHAGCQDDARQMGRKLWAKYVSEQKRNR